MATIATLHIPAFEINRHSDVPIRASTLAVGETLYTVGAYDISLCKAGIVLKLALALALAGQTCLDYRRRAFSREPFEAAFVACLAEYLKPLRKVFIGGLTAPNRVKALSNACLLGAISIEAIACILHLV